MPVALTISPPREYSRLLSSDRRPYQTNDGSACALVCSDKQWSAFFRLIGLDKEADRDPRLNGIGARTGSYDFVYDWFSHIMKTRTTAGWMRFFKEADILHPPLHESRQPDRRLASRRCRIASLRVAGPASTRSKTPPPIRHHPPGLGEHGGEILREAGFGESEIEALIAGGGLIEADS